MATRASGCACALEEQFEFPWCDAGSRRDSVRGTRDVSCGRDREAIAADRGSFEATFCLQAGSSERRSRANRDGRHCGGAYRLRDICTFCARSLPSLPLARAEGTARDERSDLSARHGDSRAEEGGRERENERRREEERSEVGGGAPSEGVKWGKVGSAVCGRRSSGVDYTLELFA